MIISHKYKFIFIKPTKVGGTSLELALAKHCDENDIVTPVSEFNPKSDSSTYEHKARNYEDQGFYNHITPKEIKEKIGTKLWDEYFKFTIVRNPWDQVLSRYFWINNSNRKPSNTKISKDKLSSNLFNPKAYIYFIKKLVKKFKVNFFYKNYSLKQFIAAFPKEWTNTRYYFDENKNPLCDFYIKFENLDSDFKKVCDQLGIAYQELPKTKNKQRKERKPYSEYYDNKTKAKVEKLFQKEVAFFNYKFDQK